MKWLLRVALFLAVLLVAGVLTLLVLGSGANANRLQTSVTIQRPPAEVWPWLYEPEKLKTWVSWLKEVRRDRDGSPATGAHMVWVMSDANNDGQMMNIAATVLAADAPRQYSVDLSVPGAFTGRAQYTLTDIGGGATRLEVDSRYTFEVWMAKLFTPLVISQARKKMDMDLQHLKSAVENAR